MTRVREDIDDNDGNDYQDDYDDHDDNDGNDYPDDYDDHSLNPKI